MAALDSDLSKAVDGYETTTRPARPRSRTSSADSSRSGVVVARIGMPRGAFVPCVGLVGRTVRVGIDARLLRPTIAP